MKPIVKNLDKKLASLKNLSLKYRPRSGEFKDSTGNCRFNPESGMGYSYHWYELTKVIKGQLVLNDYHYSASTLKHISKVRRVLQALGVEYVTLEAPRGLQNLDVARDHIASVYGKEAVADRYSRNPRGVSLNQIEQARALGLKFPAKLLKEAVVAAEKSRLERLKEARERKERKRQEMLDRSPLIKFAKMGDASKQGIHLINPDRYELNRAVEQAERDGFNAIYIHTKRTFGLNGLK